MRIVLFLILLAGWPGRPDCFAQSNPGTSAGATSVRPGINTEYQKPDVDVEQWVERFEREGREIFDHRKAIVDALHLQPKMSVADVGAGSGLFTLPFADAVGPQGKVYAADIVPGFLRHIEVKAAEAGLENIHTVLCTERSAELAPESIDLAFICDAYHHFEYPQQTMESIHRALRPKGQLVVVEFRRVEGESSDWILRHVRAGQEVFTREIEAVGFRKTGDLDLLKDNYFLRFSKN
jgi:ubiquinone/menaquinone biosynthesis C-methylase UbiE